VTILSLQAAEEQRAYLTKIVDISVENVGHRVLFSHLSQHTGRTGMSYAEKSLAMTRLFGYHPPFTQQQTGSKKLAAIFVFIALLLCGQLQVSLAYDIYGFTLSGDIRTGWVQYDYSNPSGNPSNNKGHRDSRGFYIIPKISLETPSWKNFRAKITGAFATDFGLNDHDRESRNFVFDADDNESFAILQELYVAYENDRHKVLVGRNEIYTPMIEADDYYMLANSFEVASYTYKSPFNTDLHAGYFYQMAGVWDSGDNGTEFNSMSDASFVPEINKDEANDSGVYYGAVDFNNDLHHFQLWEYYAEDLYNILFSQYNYTNKSTNFSYDAGAQFINFTDVGDLEDSNTRINYSIYSLKFDAAFNNGFSIDTGVSKYTDGNGHSDTLGAWGGYPYFANGMIFHYFEAGRLRNANTYKVQAGYDFSKVGVDNLGLYTRFTYYDLDDHHSFSSDGRPQSTMRMYGIRIKYQFLGTGYFTGTYEYHDLDDEKRTYAFRLIGGFTF
jgi:hypothetical protein